ncbi:MAG: protoheme IX farnesyltransferase [Deltaproteobacteria bacterium]|nr:protoheme IX farnesyltransferase [Deltaproteobacteria bacterium]
MTSSSRVAPGAEGLAPSDSRSAVGVVTDLVKLTKPRITSLVVLTGLGGTWLARRTQAVASIDWARTAWAMAGVVLVVSGANALNMYLERDVDSLMTRTESRPLPARRLPPLLALVFGLALGFGSLPLLWFRVNALTAALAVASLLGYVWVYTPLKRVTPWAVAVGAIPGAMPPLLGWTAATGSLGGPGLALFAVLFFWQLPHFLAIATFRESEYTRAGIKVMPAVHGARITRAYASFFTVALVAASLTLVRLGVGGSLYLAGASILGGLFLFASARRAAGDAWARPLFYASLVYLPALLAAMLIELA